jgi:hypothetical protein
MKGIYSKPVAEITEFQQADMITTSTNPNTGVEQMNPNTPNSDGWI